MTTTVTFPVNRGGDGLTYSDDADPITGLDNYGYVTRFMMVASNVLGVGSFAVTQADAAAASAVAAAASASSALNAPGTNATSTTSLAIGPGSKVFTIQSGKAYAIGQTLNAASAADPSNFMAGQVTAYSGTSLTINVTQTGGSGTKTDWVISMAAIVSSTLPSQTGNNGKFLTTNGTSASWADALIPSGNLSGLANYTTARANLGLTIGTNVQAFNANLTALAGLSLVADRLIYANGTGTVALTTFSAFARTLLDDADAATARTTLGAQASNANLTAVAGLSGAADKLPYFTGASALALADLSSFARTLIDDVDADAARTTLNAAKKGSNADITALTGLTTALSVAQGGTGATTAAGAKTNLGIGFTASGMALCTVSGSALTVVWASGNIAGISRSATGTFMLQRSTAAPAATDWGIIAIPFGNANQWSIQENYASRDTTYAYLMERNNAGNAEDGAGFFLVMFDRPT